MWHVWGRGEVRRGFWFGDPREDHLETLDVDGRVILKWILEKWEGACAGLIWLRTAISNGFL
jgi:hypothetical protein